MKTTLQELLDIRLDPKEKYAGLYKNTEGVVISMGLGWGNSNLAALENKWKELQLHDLPKIVASGPYFAMDEYILSQGAIKVLREGLQ